MTNCMAPTLFVNSIIKQGIIVTGGKILTAK